MDDDPIFILQDIDFKIRVLQVLMCLQVALQIWSMVMQ